jgi:hypothetical protein
MPNRSQGEIPVTLPITETILSEAMLPKEGEIVLEAGEVIQLISSDVPCYINNIRFHRDRSNAVIATSQRRAYFFEGKVLVVEVIITQDDLRQEKTPDQCWHMVGQGFKPRFQAESIGPGLVRVDSEEVPVLDFVYDAGVLSKQDYTTLAKFVTEDLRPKAYIMNRTLGRSDEIEVVGKVPMA